MDYFTKDYHPPGTPPGTLVEAEEGAETPLSIRLMGYTAAELRERELANVSECRPYLQDSSNTWIHVQGYAEPAILRQLGEMFNLHPLAMEDVLNTGQRPKVESYDEQLFVILSLAVIHDSTIKARQISLFLGEDYIVSFCNGHSDPFEPVRKRLRKNGQRFQSRSIDYLFYILIDLVVDEGFPILESFGEQLEELELELLRCPTQNTLAWIHRIKRELLLLRRIFWPQREVVNRLLREDYSPMTNGIKIYLRDCYDHSIQIMELLETYREMSSSMLDVYLSSVSHHTNEIMRILTIIATIFIPLTFIAGVYGMNFGDNPDSPWAMPELSWYYGYPLIWLVMIAVAVLLLIFFKRRGWF
ncbi:magnesium/cobalt transporter CorA [Nitrosococcus watsonii]|uniref:Magnesium transport protein CorA n=1 Tax=Nitrosococcus watsoni (strain C-113) TaxID=105559 RepID=D8K6M6_NITWC|nr:magnesium/cobalt transporter CorA [Nitrosococcus watsonii]ADJ28553.1 magnesium and cobalt transport protein CorA [Nitrosococcus watsonii C-113]